MKAIKNCKNLVLSLLIAIIVMAPGVLALPTYLTPLNVLYGPGLSCGTCHINPAGGGSRTAYGTLFENQANHMTNPTAALTTIGSPITTTKTTADRIIGNGLFTAGNSVNVTVVIQNGAIRSLSMKETIPSGWILTPISSDSGLFKASTNEWAWLTIAGNTVKIVKYKLTIPSDTKPGIYNINGDITVGGVVMNILGDNTVSVAQHLTPITVTSPNGGEKWKHGTAHIIRWTKTGNPGTNVKIELLRGTVATLIKSGASNSGSYKWTIKPTQTPATNYKIRITSTSNSAYTDTSNNNFIIMT